ncbi:MAG: 4Fe-4S dicluster domain-containing protein [Bifidobacteriaceae bacterium]|jgi:ferredoxin like protein|nr:4Fe-4S dicluster domain-containing protein [Bifidobacteriaceae bacterium]
MRLPPPTECLSKNRYLVDEDEGHIEIDIAAAGTALVDRLIAVCPAGVYSWSQDGSVLIEYAACLECGTCRSVAPPGSLRWRYPRGGFGVQYREG